MEKTKERIKITSITTNFSADIRRDAQRHLGISWLPINAVMSGTQSTVQEPGEFQYNQNAPEEIEYFVRLTQDEEKRLGELIHAILDRHLSEQ